MNILQKHTFIFILLAILVSMTMGGVLSSHMMTQDGVMHDCPYMGVVAWCAMTSLAHLPQWQNMFAATAEHVSVLALLMIAVALVIARFTKHILPSIQSPPRAVSLYAYREQAFDSLRAALARGIMHPKIF